MISPCAGLVTTATDQSAESLLAEYLVYVNLVDCPLIRLIAKLNSLPIFLAIQYVTALTFYLTCVYTNLGL